MSERVGVYICECGPNIKEAMDLDEVVHFAQGLRSVVTVKQIGVLCAQEGRVLISEDINALNLTRVVVGACSPKEHEATFREALDKAGLNPYLLQMANLREQCAWVTPDRAAATVKAKALIGAAVHRVIGHEPLETKAIDAHPDVMVVGGGVAGISAALSLAQNRRRVYLVENSSFIGGKAALYEDLFPSMECGSCVLEPMLDEVLHHDQIEVLTCSEVTQVVGYFGNFTVQVTRRAKSVDGEACIGCGACVTACPVRVENEINEGMDERAAIYVPFEGALPNVPVVDRAHCLRFQGKSCEACTDICPLHCIDFHEADETEEIPVGAVVLATGFDLFDPGQAAQYGYKRIENVYTSLEFERMVNVNGPTGGKIQLRSGRPPSKIALIHCVGSRTRRFCEHCSGICCAYSLKHGRQAIERLAEVSVLHLYSDLCLPGKRAQPFYHQLSDEPRIRFLHMKTPDGLEVSESGGDIGIDYRDASNEMKQAAVDMVVLAPAMRGKKGAEQLAGLFELVRDSEGFFVEADESVSPVATTREGIFVAGCARGPQSIAGSVAEGQAAAGRILSNLIPGEKIVLEPLVAQSDGSRCSGCKMCLGLCPYHALAYDEREKRVEVNELLCRGCGVCAAACPSGAIRAHHFADTEISEEIKGLMAEGGREEAGGGTI